MFCFSLSFVLDKKNLKFYRCKIVDNSLHHIDTRIIFMVYCNCMLWWLSRLKNVFKDFWRNSILVYRCSRLGTAECSKIGGARKGGFFQKVRFVFQISKSQKKKYSKNLSWAWNLNFPPITVKYYWRKI